jgi:hypothetical protein
MGIQSSLRGIYEVIDEATSGVLFPKIATSPTAPRNDEKNN